MKFFALLACMAYTAHAQTPGWGGNDCDLKIEGFPAGFPKFLDQTGLNGLWPVCGESKHSTYCFAADEDTHLELGFGTYNGTFVDDGWYIHIYNNSKPADQQTTTLARCRSKACFDAKSPDLIPAHAAWEVSRDMGKSFVASPTAATSTTSCCPSTPASCGARPGHPACTNVDCANKYTSFWSCLGSSALGCCSASKWAGLSKCVCQDTRPKCKPLATTVTRAWPHPAAPVPWSTVTPLH